MVWRDQFKISLRRCLHQHLRRETHPRFGTRLYIVPFSGRVLRKTVVTSSNSTTGVSYIFLNTFVICYFPTNTITNLKVLSIGLPFCQQINREDKWYKCTVLILFNNLTNCTFSKNLFSWIPVFFIHVLIKKYFHQLFKKWSQSPTQSTWMIPTPNLYEWPQPWHMIDPNPNTP